MLTELSELAHKTRHWGGRENIWTLQQKYLRSKKSALLSATWLPTLLPLDSCLACQREPTMLSRLDLVWSTAPPLTPCNKKIRNKKQIDDVMMSMLSVMNMRVTRSNRAIENTTNILLRSNIFSGKHQRSIGAWRSVLRLCSGEFLVVKCHLRLSTLVSDCRGLYVVQCTLKLTQVAMLMNLED